MTDNTIYHICTQKSWKNQLLSSNYVDDSLKDEKFIHCSLIHQIEGVLERYFMNVNDLLLLTIDTSRLTEKMQFDRVPNGEKYPHVYGPINKDAIYNVEKIKES